MKKSTDKIHTPTQDNNPNRPETFTKQNEARRSKSCRGCRFLVHILISGDDRFSNFGDSSSSHQLAAQASNEDPFIILGLIAILELGEGDTTKKKNVTFASSIYPTRCQIIMANK